MEQTDRTKKFIEGVKALVSSGFVKNHAEIITALEWTKASFSNVMNARRNIPADIYKKFSEVYNIEDTNIENFTAKRLIRIEAISSVLISAIAELLAIQKDKTAGGIIDDLNDRVNLKIKQIMDKSGEAS